MTGWVPDLRIIVCGVADRGDDGAALAAVSHLLPALPATLLGRIEVKRRPQLDIEDIVSVAHGEACIVVDTVVGVEPGTVVVRSLDDLARRPAGVAPRSTHALPVSDALLVAEAVRGSLPDGAFVGIGGRWFGYGQRFSRAVKAGLPAFDAALRAAIQEALAVPT
jgi:hydrogenase maturation protease